MNASSIVVGVIVGTTTGVISSFAVWWALTRRIKPDIEICPSLAVFRAVKGHMLTQFRVRNVGRRAAYDITIHVSVATPSLLRAGVVERSHVETLFSPALRPGASPRWPIRLERSESLTQQYEPWLPEAIQVSLRNTGRIPTDEFLRLVQHASVRVVVFASDAYSRTREYFDRSFTADDLKTGRFIGQTCRIAPPDEDQGDDDATFAVD